MIEPVITSSSDSFDRRFAWRGGDRHRVDNPSRVSSAAIQAFAVDGSAASRAAVVQAVRLAAELLAPIVFVYVRRGPAGVLDAPVYERRLTVKMARARRVLQEALAVADEAGVPAEAEILEGSPRLRISEFARDRDARLIVVGSRRRELGPSVSTGVIRTAGVPVTVMQFPARLSAAA